RDVGVQEEIECDFLDLESERHAVVERHADARDVLAAKDVHASLAAARLLARDRAIDEALHVRQEGDELLVIALADLAGLGVELVAQLAPRIAQPTLL